MRRRRIAWILNGGAIVISSAALACNILLWGWFVSLEGQFLLLWIAIVGVTWLFCTRGRNVILRGEQQAIRVGFWCWLVTQAVLLAVLKSEIDPSNEILPNLLWLWTALFFASGLLSMLATMIGFQALHKVARRKPIPLYANAAAQKERSP